ncbi:hypothetical protein AJ79_04200 [Helicocarpus griseus UAMH5409]|uniref:Zn(2)-C6 fungal-type domain-containing protein n=1 Tax=Helicocarpus griseus UAMH5409 TaxID=1447875 RepID=A0A2B7XUD1_9EURO|nr:hypothetical protein AJ79_04200 [Helicocarpus griseus UAMH5409]
MTRVDQDLTTSNNRPRKSHRKSRLGCADCKRRRIKCDEGRPACFQCNRHSIECSFIRSDGNGIPQSTSSPPDRIYQFKPSQYQSRFSSPLNVDGSRTLIATQCSLAAIEPIRIEELQLLHHYSVATYRTLAADADGYTLWQSNIPNWGFSFRPMLHLVLSLSALHLGHHCREQWDHFATQSDAHLDLALRSFPAAVTQLSAENCQLLYVSATLICLVYLARKPRFGEYLVFNEAGQQAEWLGLLAGVRSILELHRGMVFTSALSVKKESCLQVLSSCLPASDEVLAHRESITRSLTFFRGGCTDSEWDIHNFVANNLIESFDQVHKTKTVTRLDNYSLQLVPEVFGWLYRLPGAFIDAVKVKNPLALVILAHWCVLLKELEAIWFMEGWAGHIIAGIQKSLHANMNRLIEWPLMHIGLSTCIGQVFVV